MKENLIPVSKKIGHFHFAILGHYHVAGTTSARNRQRQAWI
jgi:hypothetical protein